MNICHDAGGRRRFEDTEFTLHIYPGTLSEGTIYCPVSARKVTSAAEVIEQVIERLRLDRARLYVLAEVKEFGGEEWILNPGDCPVQRMMLWPRMALENRISGEDYRFLLREKNLDGSIHYGSLQMWLRVTEERRRLVERGLLPQPPAGQLASDLCALPDLNERTLLENLRGRFRQEKIYTYVGGILIVVNPFKFLPIYNPKYVKMYDNHQLGKLEPHIYAVADVAYHAMLQRRRNQCIVISGESGSGKTQSTNFLIHHLTALSQKGFASGVEQIILGAGPVLEAFGNAKTAHNNNSSRFGKFIQVNYQESGTVRGAYVEKYLLEKSRLVYQEHNERNYHVFYYLLAGASEEERKAFHLLRPEEYHYLNQMTKKAHRLHWGNYCESELDCFSVEGEDLKHDFERLQLAMEMVGFLPATRKQILSLLSAILLLGNIRYKKKTYRDDSIDICNPEVLPTISELLEVKEEMLFEALTTRKTVTVGERLIVPYKLAEAGTVRDSMAKSLYGALFDWIVFRTNHALLNNKDLEDSAKILSIGVLDIFGFEDYENNSFEQFCINFANERLQHYFNQHIFKLEQEEYRAEGISWHMIDYIDNTSCINLISKKPTALLHLLDEECNFPQASNQTLLDKFKRQHDGNSYIEFPAVMEPAFIIHHYAGKVKYSVKDFREKNTDHMRPDIVALLKSSKSAFICGLMGIDPVATFRWAVLRAYFRAVVAFRGAGKWHREKKSGSDSAVQCTVIKSVDSFSFLHHPVHQRSLEILQRCKDDKYNSCITRRNPRSPLSDLQGTNTLNEKSTRDGFSGCNGRSSRPGRLATTGSAHEEDGIFVNAMSSRLLERACTSHAFVCWFIYFHSLCVQHLLDVKSLKHLSSLTLHDRITKSLLHLHKKKKPPSISAQFQSSLNKLMETLGQSEPYFVKCIRSNAEKLPLRFNDALVLRQLRYTGMLETVRIRQSGYSVKYTFQDFAHHFHVLLPDGTGASQAGIREFLKRADLDPDGYQVGKTMVFLREVQRQRLQDLLHQEVLRRIVMLQRKFRALLERKLFINQRQAALVIQHWWRKCMLCHSRDRADASELRHGAAVCLQAAWRGYEERKLYLLQRGAVLLLQRGWRRCMQRRWRAAGLIQATWRAHRQRQRYLQLCRAIITLQAACRGHQARQRCRCLREEQKTHSENNKEQSTTLEDLQDFQKRTSAQITDLHLEELHQSSETSQEEHRMEFSESLSSEHCKTLDDSTLKSRAKRESRRKRELEQATFSLELLKVRSNNVPLSDQPVPLKTAPPYSSPQSSFDSHGSFELLIVDDAKLEELDHHHHPDLVPIDQSISVEDNKREHKTVSEVKTTPVKRLEPSSPIQPFNKQTVSIHFVSSIVSLLLSLSLAISLRYSFLPCFLALSKGTKASSEDHVLWRSGQGGLTEEIFLTHRQQVKKRKRVFIPPLFRFRYLLQTKVRGKMRFWGKGKHSEKKMSTRGRSAEGDLTKADSPPRSPERSGGRDHGRDSKENREPEVKMMMMTMRRRRSLKISSITQEPTPWQSDSLVILTCTADYRSMNDFLMKKINDLETEDSKKDSPVDVVFKKALKEFRLNIFNSYSTALAMDDGRSIRYKDLYALFEHILEKSMRLEQRDWSESPVKVWVNTFKVFLDEFMTEYKPMDNTIGRAPKPERKKRRKKETDIVEEHMGHIFKSTQYSIPTYCEYCSSLIWMMDRACVCKRELLHIGMQFGVELSRLTSDERAVPLVVEKLINYIEMHGLYTEGIYRKSGSTNKIKELKLGLDTDANTVNLDDYNIHVIASVLKQWLRDLPNPLMTFELYDEFLRATGLQDKREVVKGVYTVIDQLSRTHLGTLERLIFHLVRISLQEETNRMSANALAIVFAPCILRCPDSTDPLQSVQDIGKTTACVEMIICQQMNKYKARLKDINTLEFAESKAKNRLTHIRRSMGKARIRRSSHHTPSPPMSPRSPVVAEPEVPEDEGVESSLSDQQQAAMQQEETVLTQQIESLQKEKEELTYEMLALEPRASDDEMLESEASIGTADSSENLMKNCSTLRSRKTDSKSRRALRRQPESLDSVDSAVASLSSTSSTPHYRFRSSSSGPLFSSASGLDHPHLAEQEASEQPVLNTRCASSSEKTRPRTRGNRSCPPKPRESGEGGGRRRDTEFGSVQPLVLYGSNEFMV
uniref:Myosin IXAb n=1 Tax=Astyanax mexicanus TaxID=7994 RepID=A0A8B9LK39_ASTMX